MMNFLSRLWKKKETSYIPVNRLETLFHESAHNPSQRPEFYRTLFHFDLFCLGYSTENDDGSKMAQFRTSEFEGVPVIFAFTSLAALEWYLKQKQLPPCNYLGLKADTLFQMIQGKLGMILNPGHDCSKFFTPSEILDLVQDDGGLDRFVQNVPAGQKFSIGQPRELPLQLLESLNVYAKKSPSIKEIYFGLLVRGERDPEYLGVIEFQEIVSEEILNFAFQDLITISRETLNESKPVNFTQFKQAEYGGAIDSGALKAISTFF